MCETDCNSFTAAELVLVLVAPAPVIFAPLMCPLWQNTSMVGKHGLRMSLAHQVHTAEQAPSSELAAARAHRVIRQVCSYSFCHSDVGATLSLLSTDSLAGANAEHAHKQVAVCE